MNKKTEFVLKIKKSFNTISRLTVTTTQIKHNPNSSIEDPSQLLTVEEITLEN